MKPVRIKSNDRPANDRAMRRVHEQHGITLDAFRNLIEIGKRRSASARAKSIRPTSQKAKLIAAAKRRERAGR